MKPEIKKLLILNAPYLLFVYLFDKVGQAVRLAPGADMSAKLLSIGDGFSAAFSNAFPSVHPADLLIGLAGAVIVRLAVYIKGKNAKKYRKGIEYGSARWGKAEDISACGHSISTSKKCSLVLLSKCLSRYHLAQKPLQKWHRQNPTTAFCRSPRKRCRISCGSLI